ncbi:MAG: radical SAM protein [Bacteroidales bacterium]|nr:radical SAM protein [Bacteroidales bacterium]MDY6001646.1 radical SAM protein [Candidatus Cryptobacteroides sp.]
MLRENIVFGPIHSRRLGASLGINLLPQKGKLCDFDCIYCECGWNKDGLGDRNIPSADDVNAALGAMLQECARCGVKIDSITFSGDGEPTLNTDFPEIIDITLALRDKYYPSAKVSVLSNSTRISRKEVFEALRKVDNPIMKIDAPTDELAARINKPACEYHVSDIVGELKKFNGDFILQTMFLKSPDFDSSSPEVLEGWMEIVRKLRPREIMVYTLDRPAPAQNLSKFTVEEMTALVQPLADEGFNIQVRG